MSGCAAQTFSGVTPEQFTCLIQKAQSSFGVTISGNSGTASKDGLTVAWDFDLTAQTLTLQCTDKPFFLSCGTINSQIHTLVDDCTGS
jgi:hypothetical protein